MIQRHKGGYRWEGVEVHPYKEDGNHFKTITRQTLFRGENDLPVEFRYFEVGTGGHSTLERHDHSHVVLIIRGSGQVLVADDVFDIGLHDLIKIPPQTWHQFRATKNEPLGFLCIVSNERDRPERPDADRLAELRESGAVAEFIRH